MAGPFSELLGLGACMLTDGEQEAPGVLITIRPAPDDTWQTVNFALTLEQAYRMQQDLLLAIQRFQQLQGPDPNKN